ncbi:MAG: hypothetical protein EAX81_03385 [Candidatus Thorarchaeota archaeon]|nr:hypothetical protein [Candidatus Thorarchaeota archaeon]
MFDCIEGVRYRKKLDSILGLQVVLSRALFILVLPEIVSLLSAIIVGFNVFLLFDCILIQVLLIAASNRKRIENAVSNGIVEPGFVSDSEE